MVPAPVALHEQLTGVWLTEMIFVMARLGVADHLAAGPRSAEELVGLTGANAGALPRLLRVLAAIGLLSCGSDGRYALTRLSSVLRTDAPNSKRDIALYGGSLPSMIAAACASAASSISRRRRAPSRRSPSERPPRAASA